MNEEKSLFFLSEIGKIMQAYPDSELAPLEKNQTRSAIGESNSKLANKILCLELI